MVSKFKNMQEFAKACGISRPTISKYFNDPQSVKPATRAKIEAAIAEHDYAPNMFALNQNRKLTKNVGIVVPHHTDPFFAEMARKLEWKLQEAGFSPSVFSSYGSAKKETEILESIRAMKPAGVLIAPLGDQTDRAALERFTKRIPTVLFDSEIEGLGDAFVGSDNESFIQETVEYLDRVGEPPVFFEMQTPANPNAVRRHDAFIEKMTELGHSPEIYSIPGSGWKFEELGYEGAKKFLRQKELPSASILCSNDRLAMGFLAAAYEKGVKIGRKPADHLRLASNDDHPMSRFTCPALTTSAHDYSGVSNLTVQTFINRLDQGCAFSERPQIRLPARLVLRDSA